MAEKHDEKTQARLESLRHAGDGDLPRRKPEDVPALTPEQNAALDALWERSAHGTHRDDLAEAYVLGWRAREELAAAERRYFQGYTAGEPHPHMPATGSEGRCELCGEGRDTPRHQRWEDAQWVGPELDT